MNLVIGHDAAVAKWAEGQFGRPMAPWFRAVGVIDDDGMLRAAAVFFDWNGFNAELAYVGTRPMTAGTARRLARFAFRDLQVTRVTARILRSNRAMAQSLPKLGFRFEGVSRRYYGPLKKHDACNFGLTRDDARRLLGD